MDHSMQNKVWGGGSHCTEKRERKPPALAVCYCMSLSIVRLQSLDVPASLGEDEDVSFRA